MTCLFRFVYFSVTLNGIATGSRFASSAAIPNT
jgi:hypothetical protein